MRLKQIKLAGFKSFVDPTVLDLQSNLVSIVGPNGCGKSNTIDAVRWVMGESSAKHLRGESMTDVIFNGSGNRKPVGQATVELIFDNESGKLGGEYASYANISIKRQVTKDGQSSYFLNNTKCRRRDVVDVFLGTGLGPRSYSIIEQGMVSRVIESKPENLRAFFDEAAGISVYYERRRQTENRMRHTAENLARIDDLRQEISKNLEKLKRQSEAAQKYQQLSIVKSKAETDLVAYRWQNFATKEQEYNKIMRDLAVLIEKHLADKASTDLELERWRQQHEHDVNEFNVVQAKYYEFNASIARIEQQIRYEQDKLSNLNKDYKEVTDSITTYTSQQSNDASLLQQYLDELAILTPDLTNSKQQVAELREIYLDADASNQEWHENWHEANNKATKLQSDTNLYKQQIEQFENQVNDANFRISRLHQEEQSLVSDDLQERLNNITLQLNAIEQEEALIKQNIELYRSNYKSEQANLQATTDQLNELQSKLQQSKGRLSSLEALQNAALNNDKSSLQKWLQNNALEGKTKLLQAIKVVAGYENAVEIVLSNLKQALLFDNVQTYTHAANNIKDICDSNLAMFNIDNNIFDNLNTNKFPDGVELLIDQVTLNTKPLSILNGIGVVKDIDTAISLQTQLSQAQSIVTLDGCWLGRDWCLVLREQDLTKGVVERSKIITELQINIELMQDSIQSLVATRTDVQNRLKEIDIEINLLQNQHQNILRNLRDIDSQKSACIARLDQINARRSRISKELLEYNDQQIMCGEKAQTMRSLLEESINQMATFEQKRDLLQMQKQEVMARVATAREELQLSEKVLLNLQLSEQRLNSSISAQNTAINRINEQLIVLQNKQQALYVQLNTQQNPDVNLELELKGLLNEQAAVDVVLSKAREAKQIAQNMLQDLEGARSKFDNDANTVREQLNVIRLEWQSTRTRQEDLQAHITEKQIDITLVISNLPAEINEDTLILEIKELDAKIARLGPINLAAVEEYSAEQEREQYLILQFTDLTQALETLENAIKKIDKETKTKFMETFETVHENFTKLFPKLFGGGRATLELVGDDMLTAGVAVMAQPPGKKNSSIQLLSGGEKALTAVALVFAIFQLNPSPFCILDEVDAPLDDVNVGRLCNLLKEMSDKVQFIFITHNKLTMEISQQLVGVTMKEPGVSRLVSVDIAAAMELVTA